MSLKQASALLCARCGFLPAVKGPHCAHCAIIERMRDMLERGLTVRDVAEALRLDEKAVTALCLCTERGDYRAEHPRCPKHVLDVERRLRA